MDKILKIHVTFNLYSFILTKIIRRAYGSRNLHFLLNIASQVLNAPTVLIQYTSYIFFLLNIFYIQNFGTKILTKIIRRAYGSRNLYFNFLERNALGSTDLKAKFENNSNAHFLNVYVYVYLSLLCVSFFENLDVFFFPKPKENG